MAYQSLVISDNEKIFLDGREVPNVVAYQLSHSAADNTAELTLKIAVNVSQVGSAMTIKRVAESECKKNESRYTDPIPSPKFTYEEWRKLDNASRNRM